MIDPFQPALEQAELVRRKEVRARELVLLYQERIERHNDALNAYWLLTPELALEQADDVDRARRGRLSGVPVSVKDIVALAGFVTTFGSRAFEHAVTDYDQFPVARLKEEGSPILGKTTTPEFGSRPVTEFGLHGTARNPWNLDHTPGGSSGGAAAALAAGLCAWAHGTDGGGSIRIPASCCGLVGLKPSRGRVSRGPVQGEGWAGLSTDGVLARTVADAAAGLDAIAGHLPGDPYWADPEAPFHDAASPPRRRLRIAFTTAAASAVDPEVAAAVVRAAEACEAAGHEVREAGPDTAAFRAPQLVVVMAGSASWEVADVSVLDPINQDAFTRNRSLTAADYYKAVTSIRIESRRVVAFWDSHDVLITPTLTQPPPRHGHFADPASAHERAFDWLAFTYPYNCTGQPALSLPLAAAGSGLPIGVQLVGPPRGEAVILSLAAELEQALPWSERRPPAFA